MDHNPSHQTAKGSFHGTRISIFQSAVKSNQGEYSGGIKLVEASGPIELPEDYAIDQAVACFVSKLNVPESTVPSRNTAHTYGDVLQDERD